MASRAFQDVVAWQAAHRFVLAVYALTRGFPMEELFGLSAQFRRAAVSIAANFAEGFKRTGKADKLRFYNTSQASVEECRYYLILTRDLDYADAAQELPMLEQVSRMLHAYAIALRRPNEP